MIWPQSNPAGGRTWVGAVMRTAMGRAGERDGVLLQGGAFLADCGPVLLRGEARCGPGCGAALAWGVVASFFPLVWSRVMAVSPMRSDANRCFVCGPGNERGLRLRFVLDGEVCRSEFTPTADHCGYDGVAHGGLLFSVLDDVMANWLFLRGERGLTARCDVRYREPLPVGVTVLAEGRCESRRGRLAKMAGELRRQDTGEVVVSAIASFMVVEGPGPDGRG